MSSEGRTAQTRRVQRDRPELLIVGAFRDGVVGGIHRCIEEQRQRLGEDLSVSVYNVAVSLQGAGIAWFVWGFFGSIWTAVRFPFQSRPDIVHVHTSHRLSFYRTGFYVLFTAYVWRRPVVLHIHGSAFDEFIDSDSRFVRSVQSFVFSATDRIIVLSDYWQDTLRPRVEGEKLQVVPNAVAPDAYDPSFAADPPHVVFLSTLIRRKGVLELVSALETLEARGVPFQASIAGDGPLADVVAELSERHDNVDYLGYVSETEKHELLNEGSIFVLPTHAEGLPIALLEAMAGGNAIVSTTVAAIPDVVGPENGILIDPGNEDQLADALETLLSSPERFETMARRNRALVEEEYSWDRMTDQLKRIYDEQHGKNTLATS